MLTRRSFLGRAFGASLAAQTLLPSIASAATAGRSALADTFDLRVINDRLRAVFNYGGNAVVLTSADGKAGLLSDCKFVQVGPTLRRELAAAGLTLTYVVNTHHHLDHSGGTFAFNRDLPLIAHKNYTPRATGQVETLITNGLREAGRILPEDWQLRPEYAADLKRFQEIAPTIKPDDYRPDTEIDAAHELAIGNEETVELRHFGPGHTDNDVVLRFPKHNVVHTGDLLFHGMHPYVDAAAGATTTGWQKALDAVIALCDSQTVVVPGHGEIANVEALRAQHRYFDQLREVVAAAMKEGKPREEVMKLQPEVFASLERPQFLPNALGATFDELSK